MVAAHSTPTPIPNLSPHAVSTRNRLYQKNRFPTPTSEILELVLPLRPQIVRVQIAAQLLVWIDIEALSVAFESYRWDDGPAASTVVDVIPLDAAEERMLLDSLCSAGDVAEST